MRRGVLLTVFMAALAGAAPSTGPATGPATAPMRLPRGVRVLKDLAYVDHPTSINERLDLYLPEAPPARPLPVIVFFHGGAWHKGDKDHPSAAVKFVARGYAVASVEYRFTQEAAFPAQIFDAKAAVRWLRGRAGEYQLDPDHVAAWGTSAGGHLAALLGTGGGVKALEGELGNLDQSSRVQAVVDCYGPADLTHPMLGPSIRALLGGTPGEKHELAVLASPVAHVSGDDPPFLILHGDADATVPVEQSKALAAALKAAGVPVTLHLLAGEGHGTEGFKAPAIAAEIEAFGSDDWGGRKAAEVSPEDRGGEGLPARAKRTRRICRQSGRGAGGPTPRPGRP